jgi:hypothetical protein
MRRKTHYQALEDANERAAAFVQQAVKAIRRGNCYVTCEALYHLLGGKKAGWIPHWVKHEGDTHWFLAKRIHEDLTSVILDPTRKQFKTEPHYLLGRSCGFLTKRPSKRAKALMKTMLWQ